MVLFILVVRFSCSAFRSFSCIICYNENKVLLQFSGCSWAVVPTMWHFVIFTKKRQKSVFLKKD